jgi:hypothetical protein
MRPAQSAQGARVNYCGPRLTLAGPTLIRSLVHFGDQELNPIPVMKVSRLRRLAPPWLMSALIIGTVMTAGVTGAISLFTRQAGPVEAAVEAAPAPTAASTASPLSRAIEVTGFRIQMDATQTDPAKKSEIQYLVVNHTANAISGVTVYVTLRAANASAGQAPLARFQFAAPHLGPYQAKEMASAIERVTRPISLPDWQDLRVDIEVGQ